MPGAQIAPNLTGLSVRLRDLPYRAVFERSAGQLVGDDRRLIGLLHLPEDVAGLEAVAAHPTACGRAMAVDPAQALDRIEKPRLAADIEIEAAVAIGHDVEPGGFLRVDHRGDRIEILLAEHRVAHRRLERAAVEVLVVPQRSRIGPGDRGRHDHVAGGFEHRVPPLIVIARSPQGDEAISRRLGPLQHEIASSRSQ